MRLDGIELRWVRLPLVAPFQTSFCTEYDRLALLVRVYTDDGVEGWGECVAMPEPIYSTEYIAGAADMLKRFLIPAVARLTDVTAEAASTAFGALKGHPMAKAALEMAILDAQLQLEKRSLADYLGAVETSVRAGVSVGIMASVPELLDAVDRYLDLGYQRIKLKIQPNWDEVPVRAVHEHIQGRVPLQVDANGAYTLADAERLARLDAFDLLMIEQPLDEEDLMGHAELARRVKTRICLDEPITSPAKAVEAIECGAAEIINIKPGRVGGYLKAREIHDVCAKRNVPVWVGGMLETGIGRAANVALAALPDFSLVGDVSESKRFFARDITPPVTMKDGLIEVPTDPGIGVRPDDLALREATVKAKYIRVKPRR